ncbi:MAG: type IV secretory system conjugative DNA transfer family protein, partial [Streptosporangiaceae bacterium]
MIKLLILAMAAAAIAGLIVAARSGRAATLPRNRVRHMRWRLHARRRPGPGFATGFALWWHFSAFASRRGSGRQTRPGLTARERRREPHAHSVLVGRAHHRHAVRVPVQEHLVVFAPPRTGKTQFLGAAVIRYPGPVLSTSTKPDVFRETSGVRQLGGPVEVFNPQGIGGIGSTFAWDPVAGCEDPAVAIRRADGFANAAASPGAGENKFFEDRARAYLRALFHAAALAGGDMRLVSRWARTASTGGAVVAEEILRDCGRPDWADELAQLRSKAERTAATNEMVLTGTLGFMVDPRCALAVLPSLSGDLDLEEYLTGSGTLYMIADPAGNDEAPLAPLFAALAAEVHHVASVLGRAGEGGRLDPPLLMALDEATQICRVPLPRWLADSGGRGIQVATVVHGEAQLAETWGRHGAQVIMDTSACKVVLPGVSDPDTLRMLSDICGTIAYRRGELVDHEPVMTPAMINQLPAGRALVKWGNRAPVIVAMEASRRLPAVRLARKHGRSVAQLTALPGDSRDPCRGLDEHAARALPA